MKQVKLIIANTQTDTVYFNYGDDYSDVTRIFVEDHSPWEEVEDEYFYDLVNFVNEYNRCKKGERRNSFAFLVEKDQKISAQQVITEIRIKREEAIKKQKEEERKRKEAAEKAKRERELKISVDNTQEKWYIDRMKEEIEMARQYLEKEKNGTLDLENLSEDEKQMRIFSEAYDKSGLAEIVTNHPEYLRCINALCRHAQCFEPTQEMVDIAISHAERMIDAEKEFENAVIEIAGGENQVEDFKFFAPDMQNPDELLKAATQMLNGEGNELRKC